MSESTLAVVHTINRIMIPLIQRRTLVFREVRWLPQITQLSDSLSLRPRKVKACVLEGQRKEGRESDLSSEGGLPPLFTGQPAIPRCQPWGQHCYHHYDSSSLKNLQGPEDLSACYGLAHLLPKPAARARAVTVSGWSRSACAFQVTPSQAAVSLLAHGT